MTTYELNLIELIVLRYQCLVRSHGLATTRDDSELFVRLCEAHQLQPLNLKSMSTALDLDLVIAVGDIDLHYCQDAKRIKDGFQSSYAISTGGANGDRM